MTRSRIGELFADEARYRKDLAEGVARIGGSWVPSFTTAYIKAARIMVANTADCRPEMVAPCAYLQRHAMELILKSTIEMANDLHWDCQCLELSKNAGRCMKPEGEPRRAPTGHNLCKLLQSAQDALTLVDHECPPSIAKLAQAMHELEDDDETRLRYHAGMHAKYKDASFPKPTIVPVVEWQDQLDAIEREEMLSSERREPPYPLWESLYLESRVCDQELMGYPGFFVSLEEEP